MADQWSLKLVPNDDQGDTAMESASDMADQWSLKPSLLERLAIVGTQRIRYGRSVVIETD